MVEENQKPNQYIQDIKNLPVWLQVTFGLIGALGTIGTLYGTYGTYIVINQPKIQETIPENIATSTPNISDIFSRYNEMSRAVDQQKFLKDYLNIPVYGLGTFDNISSSFGSDSTFYLHLSVPDSRISCQFNNVDDTTRRRLDLLKLGDKVAFLGIFTGGTMFETSRWYITDCRFIN